MLTRYQDIMQTRNLVYTFLSRLFAREVDLQLLHAMKDLKSVFEHLSSSTENQYFREGCRIISDFIEDSAKNPEENNLLVDLAAEYASLFLNVGPKPVYLVESVYLGKHHTLYEDPYFEVLDAYRMLGFEKSSEFKEPEDHLAVELEFMAKLVDLTKQCLDTSNISYARGYLKLQEEFLNEHLAKWVPQLSQKIEEATANKLYTGLARLLRGFIEVEKDFIHFIIDELDKANSP